MKQKNSALKEIWSWVWPILLAAVVAFALKTFVFANATVPTGSMEKTIMPKDRIIASRLSYLKNDPERGDIVIFKFPDNEKENYVKRVIGLPGDTVEIKDGKVYINQSSEPLEEPYVNGTPTGNFGPYRVPEGCYFMMGDNRNNSLDSRYWNNTYVKKEKIMGKVKFRYYPNFTNMDS